MRTRASRVGLSIGGAALLTGAVAALFARVVLDNPSSVRAATVGNAAGLLLEPLPWVALLVAYWLRPRVLARVFWVLPLAVGAYAVIDITAAALLTQRFQLLADTVTREPFLPEVAPHLTRAAVSMAGAAALVAVRPRMASAVDGDLAGEPATGRLHRVRLLVLGVSVVALLVPPAMTLSFAGRMSGSGTPGAIVARSIMWSALARSAMMVVPAIALIVAFLRDSVGMRAAYWVLPQYAATRAGMWLKSIALMSWSSSRLGSPGAPLRSFVVPGLVAAAFAVALYVVRPREDPHRPVEATDAVAAPSR